MESILIFNGIVLIPAISLYNEIGSVNNVMKNIDYRANLYIANHNIVYRANLIIQGNCRNEHYTIEN